jgi:hypothetical protein
MSKATIRAADFPNMTPISLDSVVDRGNIERRLRATEADVEAMFGKGRIERYTVDEYGNKKPWSGEGPYKWRVQLQQNDGHGKLTTDGAKMQELMNPWAKAAVEHVANENGFPGDYAKVGENRQAVMVEKGGKLYRKVGDELVPA